MKDFFKILIGSGICIQSDKIISFFLKHSVLRKILRLKISPLALLNIKNPDFFSEVSSLISVGPAFKTTKRERHFISDNIILKAVKNGKKKSVADIGTSDGSSFLNIWNKIKNSGIECKLYDKFNYLSYTPIKFGSVFFNSEGKIIYIRFLFFLFFIYPLDINVTDQNNKAKREIIFVNPILRKNGLKIEYFDILETKLNSKFDIIKCANLLTARYFSINEIIRGLRNLHYHLSEDGLLLLIHNEKYYEKILVLEKKSEKLRVIENHGYDEYLNILKNNCHFLYE